MSCKPKCAYNSILILGWSSRGSMVRKSHDYAGLPNHCPTPTVLGRSIVRQSRSTLPTDVLLTEKKNAKLLYGLDAVLCIKPIAERMSIGIMLTSVFFIRLRSAK